MIKRRYAEGYGQGYLATFALDDSIDPVDLEVQAFMGDSEFQARLVELYVQFRLGEIYEEGWGGS